MKKIEATGRTLQEAVETAAAELGVPVGAVEYELVEEGAKGFLGLGGVPTRVVAWASDEIAARPAAPEPVSEIEEMFGVEPVEDIVEATLEQPARAEEITMHEEPVAQAEVYRTEPVVEGDEAITKAAIELLGQVLEAMNVDAKPSVKSITEEEIVIDLVGSEVAILIGKQGQTLDAIQYLVSIWATKEFHTHRRIVIDAESYRDRHKLLLERKAREYADFVKQESKEAVFEPQSARDRRIVHVALADDPDVYTYSEGEGEDRHVVISPKK